jgi:hypothetical protein
MYQHLSVSGATSKSRQASYFDYYCASYFAIPFALVILSAVWVSEK